MQTFTKGIAAFNGEWDVENVPVVFQWNDDAYEVDVEISEATFHETVDRYFLLSLFGEEVVRAAEKRIAEQLEEDRPARDADRAANRSDEFYAVAAE